MRERDRFWHDVSTHLSNIPIFECVCTLGGNQPWECLCQSVPFPTVPACAWVHACVCVLRAGMHQLIAEWMVMLSNSTVWLHSNKLTPLPSVPSSFSSSFLRERLNLQCNLKTFLTLSHTHLLSVPPCVNDTTACVCVCVMDACYLWIPQS